MDGAPNSWSDEAKDFDQWAEWSEVLMDPDKGLVVERYAEAVLGKESGPELTTVWVRLQGFEKYALRQASEDGRWKAWNPLTKIIDFLDHPGTTIKFEEHRQSGLFGLWKLTQGKLTGLLRI